MLSHKQQDAQQVEAELKDIMHALASNGEQQGVQFASVLQVNAILHGRAPSMYA